MDLGLSGKKVLITASAGGIGLATAKAFLEEGASVIINGRNPDRLDKAARELSKQYGKDRVLVLPGDAKALDTIKNAVSLIEEKWGYLDILIPCAGSGKPISDDRLDIDEWKHMMDVNLFDSVEIIRACRPMLGKADSPSIVLVSSVTAYTKAKAPYAYAAAKSALVTLAGYMADDAAKEGLRINCVVPGNVYFEGGRWEELKNLDPEGTDRYIESSVPMNRFGTPEEIADSIVFLASKRSSFTTGTVLVVDGGQNRAV